MDNQFSYFFKFSAILEAMPDALVIINEHGRIVLINKQTEKLFGYERTEIVGEFVEQLMPKRFRNRHQQHRDGFFRLPRTRSMGQGLELFGLNKEKAEFPIEISLSPLKTDEGILVLAAVRDISHQKNLEEELRAKNVKLEEQNHRIQEANRLKSEFLANMSHELRTPLNGIIGFSELMYDEKVGPLAENHKEYLGDILNSSRHLLQLINDVLDLAKVESGRMEFHAETINLAKLIDEVKDILRTLIFQKKINVKIQIDPELSTVILDASKLKQVLYNYISNALKFSNEGGCITVSARPEGKKYFRIEVEDTGIGISKEDLKRLFVEFQQLDSSAAKKYQGTGLGLALTRRIVEAQKGHVGVDSTLHKGSKFYAVLPRAINKNFSVQVDSNLVNDPLTFEGKVAPTILVVEDDPDDRVLISDILMERGCVVEVVINGAEALRRGQERKFDLITLDLLLPDISGWEVLRAFRSKGPNKNTPIIVVSILAEKMAGIGFAIQDFLEKPVEENKLIAALQRIQWRPNKEKSILVIDDDLNAIKLAEEALKDTSYQIISETSAERGLARAQEEIPQLIILDILMPNMNGFEFLDQIRKTKVGLQIPIIVWTVKELSLKEREWLASSSQAIVSKKPGSVQVLLEELQRYFCKDNS